MNEDYPSAVKLTNDKTSRASGKMGAIQGHDFGDGQEGNAPDLLNPKPMTNTKPKPERLEDAILQLVAAFAFFWIFIRWAVS